MKATTPKNILIAGNMAGGQFTSTTIATLGDGLQTLGYSAKLIAMDSVSEPMLQKLYPGTIHIQHHDAATANNAVHNPPADITIIDCPSYYLNPYRLLHLTDFGSRVMIGLVVNTQSEHSIAGAIKFVQAFDPISSDYIILAVMDRTEGTKKLKTGKGDSIAVLSEGRVIRFPPFTRIMRRQHDARPTVPSSHIAKAGNKMVASSWSDYQKETLKSITTHAEWITGKPIPKP